MKRITLPGSEAKGESETQAGGWRAVHGRRDGGAGRGGGVVAQPAGERRLGRAAGEPLRRRRWPRHGAHQRADPGGGGLARPLLPGRGAALLVLALGVPDPPLVGEVYSLVGLCHFYDAPGSGWLSRYATLGRAPASTTSTELRTAVVLGSGAPVIQLVGVAGLNIDWTVEVYRLEI